MGACRHDAKLDLVYLPMGVTTPDIWGGNRTPEQERYASSIVALNATTGKLAWSYQDRPSRSVGYGHAFPADAG